MSYSVTVLVELLLVLFLQFAIIVLKLGLLRCILLDRLVRDVLKRLDRRRLLVFGGKIPLICFFLSSNNGKTTVTSLFKRVRFR